MLVPRILILVPSTIGVSTLNTHAHHSVPPMPSIPLNVTRSLKLLKPICLPLPVTSIGHQGEKLDGCQYVHALIQAASNPTAAACTVLVHNDLSATEAVQHGQECTAIYVHGTLQAAHQL